MKSDGLGRGKNVGVDRTLLKSLDTPLAATIKPPPKPGPPGVDPLLGFEVPAGALDVIGGAGREAEGRAGANQIAQNLRVLDSRAEKHADKSKLNAGVTGMLVALMITFSHVAPSHAQDTSQITAPHNATLFLPNATGPPSFTTTSASHTLPDLGGLDQRSTVFGAQVQALKKQEAATVDAAVQRALDQFTVAMNHTLRLDAHGAALGGPLDLSRLTDAEQSAVKKALTTLLREMPIGALAPEMTDQLGELMRARGMSTEGLEARRLRDLGDIGGDAIKQMIGNLKDEKPAVYYGLAAGLATAVGAVAYTQGTDAIGIKPELKTKFFNDQLIAKVRAEWGPEFSDPKLTTRLEHRGGVNIGGTPFTTTVGVGVIAQGSSFKNLEATGFELSGSMHGTLRNGGQLALSGYAVGSANNGLERVTLSGAYLNDPWTAGATVSYLAQEDRTVGQLSVGYKPQKNVEWALVGIMDSKGDNYVGVGLKVGF